MNSVHNTLSDTKSQEYIDTMAVTHVRSLEKGIMPKSRPDSFEGWEIYIGEMENIFNQNKLSKDLPSKIKECVADYCSRDHDFSNLLYPDIDNLARKYILEIKKGKMSLDRPDNFAFWESIISQIESFYVRSHADVGKITDMIESLCKGNYALAELLEEDSDDDTMQGCGIQIISSEMPPLPDTVKSPPDGSKGACLWHDEYVAFSKWRSPRSFHNFHEGNGWALLSTVAMHRVRLDDLGSPRYTPLFLASIASSSVSAKTEAAKVFRAVLDKAGLKWTLGPDNTTPQAMIGDMATVSALKEDSNYINWTEKEKEEYTRSLAFSGQRGWFYEEFGEQMDAMCRPNGVMADFKGIIRRMDDCYDEYSRSTVTHKKQVVEYPYLSLIACMTPLDIKVQAGANSPFWRDGFFARFAFIAPNEKETRSKARFPDGNLYDSIPDSLVSPLARWNTWLGMRDVKIEPEYAKGDQIKRYTIEYGPFPERLCKLSKEAKDAFYRYGDALDDLMEQSDVKQFEGNYKRFPMTAMRIAMLCAELENSGHIEMKHWWKGQDFAEMARSGLHALYAQVNLAIVSQPGKVSIADRILVYIKERKNQGNDHVSIRDISRSAVQGEDGEKIKRELDVLVKDGSVIKEQLKNKQGRSLERYRLP